MKFGVIVFPGSNCDHDAFYAVGNNLGQKAEFIWHASTATAVVTNAIIPVPPNTIINNPCTNEGVLVSGTIHLVTIATMDAAGGVHTVRQFNVQDVSGVGLRTDLNYRGIHTETRSSNSNSGGASELTMVVDIKLISEGSASNLTIRNVLFHA